MLPIRLRQVKHFQRFYPKVFFNYLQFKNNIHVNNRNSELHTWFEFVESAQGIHLLIILVSVHVP